MTDENKHQIRTRHLAFGAALLTIVAVAPAIPYWIAIGSHPARCFYGDPICSLTIAAYMQCLLLFSAFLAAYRAARYAKQALEHEKRPVVYVQKSLAPLPPSIRLISVYIHDLTNGFTVDAPDNFKRNRYHQSDFEFMSIGRSPVVNGTIHITACTALKEIVFLKIDIGSIRIDASTYLRLWFHHDLENASFKWAHGTHKDEDSLDLHWRKPLIEIERSAPIPESLPETLSEAILPRQKPEP